MLGDTMIDKISALTAILVLGTSTFAVAQATAPMAAPSGGVTVKLAPQNGSGEAGTAVLTQAGDDVVVTVSITGAGTVAQPIHIHEGTCAKLNPKPQYPLTTVENGKSTTTLKGMKLTALETGGYAINVHKSTTDIPAYVACGDIPTAAKGSM
jgi:CHRD domain